MSRRECSTCPRWVDTKDGNYSYCNFCKCFNANCNNQHADGYKLCNGCYRKTRKPTRKPTQMPKRRACVGCKKWVDLTEGDYTICSNCIVEAQLADKKRLETAAVELAERRKADAVQRAKMDVLIQQEKVKRAEKKKTNMNILVVAGIVTAGGITVASPILGCVVLVGTIVSGIGSI